MIAVVMTSTSKLQFQIDTPLSTLEPHAESIGESFISRPAFELSRPLLTCLHTVNQRTTVLSDISRGVIIQN
jgi:hypothetical protein